MSKYHFLTIFFLTAAILLSPGADVQAQSSTPSVSVTGNPSAKTQSNKNSKTEPSRPAKRPQHVVSEQRVEHLLGFVEQHHAASLPLLKVLKEKRAKKFARVMVHLDREVAGLDRLKDRSQRAYSNALKQWVNRSQIKLLIAKLKTETAKKESTKARRDDLTKQIRKLLNENVDIRVQQLSFEIKNAARQKHRLEKTLVDLLQSRDSKINGRIEAITKVKTRKTKESRSSKENSPSTKK